MATIIKPLIDRHWQDWADLALGFVILSSPWFLGIIDMQGPAMNAMIVGLAILGLSLVALGFREDWEEWLNVGLGLWLMASPWLLDYGHLTQPMAAHMGLGLLVVLFAGSELWQDRKLR